MPSGIRLVSEAAELAARRDSGWQRKGRGEEPSINRLAEVANLLMVTDGETPFEELKRTGTFDFKVGQAELTYKFDVGLDVVAEFQGLCRMPDK